MRSNAEVEKQAPVASPPSSGPSGHLLPDGEKREDDAPTSKNLYLPIETVSFDGGGSANSLFSPLGRRWPEGPDEGGEATVQNPKPFTKRRPGKTKQAQTLRHNNQEAEYRLWGDLRNRLLNGYKFTRQMPLGPYIADFLCRDKMLIVELDGSQHADCLSDVARTQWLNDRGYCVLRFWNHEVLQERRAVLDTVLAVLVGKINRLDDVVRFFPAARPHSDHQLLDNKLAGAPRSDREF